MRKPLSAVPAAVLAVSLVPAAFGAPSHFSPISHGDDRIVEGVPGRPDLVKVTHIFRRGRGKPAHASGCACPGADGTRYSFEKVRWFDPSVSYRIYTANSGLGWGAASAVRAGFDAWRAAAPSAPPALGTQDDVAPGPGIALDAEQAVSWLPLSSLYGSNTLAVTAYWYTRAKVNGFSRLVHFDMAFNTAYPWALLSGGESCGGAGAYDLQSVATHEAGHAYGMAHNNDCNLTMNPTAGPGETVKATLAAGDADGIRALY